MTKRAATVDLSRILAGGKDCAVHFDPACVFDFQLEKTLDERVLLPELDKFKKGKSDHIALSISSTDRTLGTILGPKLRSASAMRFPTTLSSSTVKAVAARVSVRSSPKG